jgi:gliding motility-associated-like protein
LTDFSTGNIETYSWSIPNGTPSSASTANVTTTFPIDQVGLYPVTLIVIDENGCPDTVVREVNVISDIIFYAPNTFTPDGDEFNQTWNIVLAGVDLYSVDLFIFNRWGEVIWESHDASVGWDGTYDGKVVPVGTYTWTLAVKEVYTDKKYQFNGHITLLR